MFRALRSSSSPWPEHIEADSPGVLLFPTTALPEMTRQEDSNGYQLPAHANPLLPASRKRSTTCVVPPDAAAAERPPGADAASTSTPSCPGSPHRSDAPATPRTSSPCGGSHGAKAQAAETGLQTPAGTSDRPRGGAPPALDRKPAAHRRGSPRPCSGQTHALNVCDLSHSHPLCIVQDKASLPAAQGVGELDSRCAARPEAREGPLFPSLPGVSLVYLPGDGALNPMGAIIAYGALPVVRVQVRCAPWRLSAT